MILQNWRRIKIFDSDIALPEFNYTALPCAIQIESNLLRVFLSRRSVDNISYPFYFDISMTDLTVQNLSRKKLLDKGEIGTFDDSGVMPTAFIDSKDGVLMMYYIGWNLGVTVPFRNSLGLALSYDGGKSFKRKFDGPILDRTKTEPHFNASACVLKEGTVWKMWYLSCIGWFLDDCEKPTHKYHIKYAESADGINWNRQGDIAINFIYENEYAISVPRVLFEEGIYKMWYSYRGGVSSKFYRIGYAESLDGIVWDRMDHVVNIFKDSDLWDSEMQCYPFVFNHSGNKYMLYNGNEYGKTGIGLSILEQ